MRSQPRPPLLAVGLLALGMLNVSRAASVDTHGDPLPPRAKARIGTVRFRHGGPVTAIAFSPDRRRAVTASQDRTASVWDIASGRELVRCHGHTRPVLAAAFDAPGKQLVSGSADGTVRLWRWSEAAEGVAAGQELRRWAVTEEEVQAVAIAARSTTVALGTAGGNIVLLDLATGKELRRLHQEGQVYCLALSADGKRLAANHAASGVVLWDTQRGEQVRSFGEGVVASLVFAPEGSLLAVGYHDNRLLLWDAGKGEVRRSFAGHERQPPGRFNGVLGVAFSADGRRLASGGTDDTVRVWDAETGRQTSEGIGHHSGVTAVAFAPDGKHVLTGGADSTLRRWDAATGRPVSAEYETASPLTTVTLAPDGRMLATIEAPDRLGLWSSADGRARPWPAAFAIEHASAVAFSPLDGKLAVAAADGRLRFGSIPSGAVRAPQRDAPRRMNRLVWSRDGRFVASCGPDHHIDIWDAVDAELLQHMGLQEEAHLTMAFDRQGRRLATASEADAIRMFDAVTGLEQQAIAGSFAGALALSFSADGRSLHAAGSDGRVHLWELATRQTWRVYHTEEAGISAAAFSADGRLLATGGSDGTVRLWDASSGKERHVFQGHRGPVTQLAFAVRAPVLVSASRDTTAIVWDLAGLPPPEMPPPLDLSAREIETLWEKLAGEAPMAYEALQTLRRAPGQVVPYLRARLRPVPGDLTPMLRDLDSDDYAVRARAARELSRFGRVAERAMRRALEGKPSLEVRRRLQGLLSEMGDGPELVPALPREVRCVELLESLGTSEARRVLTILAGGLEEAELTQQAKASLARLAHRSTP